MAPPPLTSKHCTGPTEFELQEERKELRREKARLRMAKRRAELKERSPEEQQQAAQRARAYQATYREKHRDDLRMWEAQRRIDVYKKKFGPEAYQAYAKQKREQKRRARERKRTLEGRPPRQKRKADAGHASDGRGA